MKRILALSCDAKFVAHAQNLLNSIHQHSPNLIDQILFFDLGLRPEQLQALTQQNVTIHTYPKYLTQDFYPDFLTPRMFAWKTYLLQEAANHGDLILYMDCGCITLNSLAPIYEAIASDDIFLIQDTHKTSERTHETCFHIMNATPQERTALQIDAGTIGFRANGRFAHIFPDAFRFAQNRACIFGDASSHRHDQSIYSILAARNNIPNPHPYGKMLHWKGIESPDQIIWQHRGKWPAFKKLIDLATTAAPSRIVIYGTGEHTQRFLQTFRTLLEPRHQILGFLDDFPRSPTLATLPIVTPENYTFLKPTAILLSSDAHEPTLYSNIQDYAPEIPIWRIYN